MNDQMIKGFIRHVRDELETDILPFWLQHSVDSENGGFIGELSHDLAMSPDADKGLVLNARLLWTFSALADFTKDERCFKIADYAYQTLRNEFWDNQYGGGFWTLDKNGTPANKQKKTYGQSFFIYGLAEYYSLTKETKALKLAQALFHLLEAHTVDAEYQGYFEVFEDDWHLSQNQQLSGEDLDAPKSMNTHLHLLEAYSRLYSVWKDPLLAQKIRALVDIFQQKIIHPDTGHFQLFFDSTWNPMNGHISFGHDIEGSWLLCRAADVLGESQLQRDVDQRAVQIAQTVYLEGLNSHSGLIYESDGKGELNLETHFWCQAEAVVGFLNAFQLSRQEHFIDSAWKTWQFIEKYQVDKEHGEWFWKLDGQYRPDRSMPKISEWKCPYHNGRACIEVVQRLKELLHRPTRRKIIYEQNRKTAGNPRASRKLSAVNK